MKRLLFTFIGVFLLLMQSCASRNYWSKEVGTQLLAEQSFTFVAERVHIYNPDVINIANALPNYNAARMAELDYGYTVVMKGDELAVELPYFGRMFNATMNRDKNSFRFTSKNFGVEETANRKKAKVFKITPKDVGEVQKMVLEVFPNGKAYLSIDANDRQPISYSGYITKNETAK